MLTAFTRFKILNLTESSDNCQSKEVERIIHECHQEIDEDDDLSPPRKYFRRDDFTVITIGTLYCQFSLLYVVRPLHFIPVAYNI